MPEGAAASSLGSRERVKGQECPSVRCTTCNASWVWGKGKDRTGKERKGEQPGKAKAKARRKARAVQT